MISWNGAELNHGTIVPLPEPSDAFFGCFMVPKKKLCNGIQNNDPPWICFMGKGLKKYFISTEMNNQLVMATI
jgi:hypothetical protein